MFRFNYLIIGGGLAGGRAAENIRKVDGSGSIALVTEEPHPPYERPPLSKGYLLGQQGLDKVYLKDEAFYAQNKIELLRGVRATQLNAAGRAVTLSDGRVLNYDKLLLATGGRARRLPIPGANLPGVFTLRTIADADALRAAAQPGAKALVVGGSFIGAEVAASLCRMGLQVTLAFMEQRLLERVAPPPLGAQLHELYAQRGVSILPQRRPQHIAGDDKARAVTLDNGVTLEVDLVVLGVGIQLETELAHQAGLDLAPDGSVLVDQYLRTSDPNIYAAGDIVAWPDPGSNLRLRVEHWDVARGQGIRAGRNMAGEAKPYTTLPYFFSDLFELSLEAWGNLRMWDQFVLRGTLEGGGWAFFYFYHGTMMGALAAGLPEAERNKIPAVVKARPAYDAVAAALADEGTDLATLFPA
jgi:3-phenylpropionate/trans-cinnamate dioxygenase ferredoxin reductase subunit